MSQAAGKIPAVPARHVLRLGLMVALAVFVIDRGFKYWMLNVYKIEEMGGFALTPFFEVVMAWNRGISYGWFQQHSDLGRWILVAVMLAATGLLCHWLWRARTLIGATGLGMIIGGALANAFDRAYYGAVADFFHFYIGSFSWYIFNIADIGIVAGVVGLIYEAFWAPEDADGKA